MRYLVYCVLLSFVIVVSFGFFLFQFWSLELHTGDVFSVSGGMNNSHGAVLPILADTNQTDVPLQVPTGFTVSYFATSLAGPRVLALDPIGHLLVSLTRSGEVVVFSGSDSSGGTNTKKTLLSHLSHPHGLLLVGTGSDTKLYVAETNQITRYEYDADSLTVRNPEVIQTLPSGGRHFTRTLLLLPDGNILVSVGSSCDVCIEDDERRASILVMKPDGTSVSPYATGLRNTVFMRLHPETHEVWGTEMGRDYLGDQLPPDEVNILKVGGFYGWPYCYGQRITDTRFNQTNQARETCTQSTPSVVDIPAHSAPLGLAFIPDSWPTGYQRNLLVSYHGSWNRSTPTGYKIVQMNFDKVGKYTGTKDFITGWLSDRKVYGRPVDLLFSPSGVLYVSDDERGVIYQIVPVPSAQ